MSNEDQDVLDCDVGDGEATNDVRDDEVIAKTAIHKKYEGSPLRLDGYNYHAKNKERTR